MSPSPSIRPILLIGSNGQLGTDLAKVLTGRDLIGLTHSQLDITQAKMVRQAVEGFKPSMVINTAAFNRVDECEFHPDRGIMVNAIGAFNLATACRASGAVLVHFSTDYVFDGAKTEPYTEHDSPNPISAYGISKLAGEHFVRYAMERYFVIRTSGLYGKVGSRGKGGNFVETMLRMGREGRSIKVVNDQTLAPTYTMDLARKVEELVFRQEFGLFHTTAGGSCTWHQFAQKVFECAGMAADLSPTTSQEYGSPARRPRYSVLCGRRLREAGISALRPWDEALKAYLEE